MSKVNHLVAAVLSGLLLSACAGGPPTANIADGQYRIRALTHDTSQRFVKVYQACYRGNPTAFRNSFDFDVDNNRLVLHAIYKERNIGASLMEAIFTLTGNFKAGEIYQLRSAINKGQMTVWAENVDDPSITTERTTKKLRFSQLVNLDSELRPLCREGYE